MIRLGMRSILAAVMILSASPQRLPAQTTNDLPDFKEVYDLVRAHAVGLNADELNCAAVRGLLSQLASTVSLVTNGNPAITSNTNALVTKSSLLDGDLAYVRIGRVGDGLADALREACQGLTTTNHLSGLVLDLRYVGGDNYAAAAAAADLFVTKDQPLLNWGAGVVKSKEKNEPLASPVAVLVNGQTAGAAEALAAVLRQAGAGLVLGSQTAGQAVMGQDFPLQNGQKLRIAATPIRLADDTALSQQGVKPDIDVAVNPQDEKAFYADPFRWIPKGSLFAGSDRSVTNDLVTATNHAARRPRFSEAELVRERREGASLEDGSAPRPVSKTAGAPNGEPDAPVVHDPVLARALDILKGLAVVRQYHS